jgi:hypothetical protein
MSESRGIVPSPPGFAGGEGQGEGGQLAAPNRRFSASSLCPPHPQPLSPRKAGGRGEPRPVRARLRLAANRGLPALCAFAVVAVAFANDPNEEAAYARRKLGVLRNHPEELARIRQESVRFEEMSPERQAQLRQLDRELHGLPSAAQARLEDTLDRYVQWLGHLPAADRERVQKADGAKARLAVVRELRLAEWIARQPKAFQDVLGKLSGAKRAEFVASGLREDRKRQAEWAVAHRFRKELAENKPLPTKPDEFDNNTRIYATEFLPRLLSKDENERLKKAEGQWPLYPKTLVDLADKHPPALPSETAPRSYADLPRPVQTAFGKKGPLKVNQLEKQLKQFEGRYPEFAVQLTKLAYQNNIVLPAEWWPATFKGLMLPMQEFVERRLKPALDAKERRELVDAETKWPEYPQTIKKLAAAHDLPAPWHVLPASEHWDAYRSGKPPMAPGFPEVAKYKLHDFVYIDLDDTDRHELKNKIEGNQGRGDGTPWAFIVESYFVHYPSELARLRAIDRGPAK